MDQLPVTLSLAQLRTVHLRVDKKTDQPLRLTVLPVGRRAPDHNVLLARVFSQQDAQTAQQHAVKARPVTLAQLPELPARFRAQRKAFLAPPVIDLQRTSMIRGKVQRLVTLQLPFPVS